MHKIEYYIVKALYFVFSRISIPAGRRIAIVLYYLVAVVIRYRQDTITENLNRVYGANWPMDRKKLLKQIYRNFIFLWMEFLQIKHFNTLDIEKHFTFHNNELLDELLAEGKGLILLSGHFGNFEWLGQLYNKKNYKVNGIAKRQSNPFVNDLIEKNRRQFGTGVIYTKNAISEGLEKLANNEILAIVTDQDARKRGMFIDFMGLPSSTAVGPAIFHLRSGAPIAFIISVRRDYGHFDVYLERVVSEPAGEVNDESIRKITQLHATVLEKWVRKYPEQWFWMHRRWKTQPPAEKQGA